MARTVAHAVAQRSVSSKLVRRSRLSYRGSRASIWKAKKVALFIKLDVSQYVKLGDFSSTYDYFCFECDLFASRENIIRYRTVLGTPRLRANAGRINNSLGRLGHPDRGWNEGWRTEVVRTARRIL